MTTSSSAAVRERPLTAGDARDRRNRGEFSDRERHQARRLFLVFLLVAVFFGVELMGAIAAKSDVLRADAVHLLMDVAALGMALWAMRLAVRKPSARFTFGLRRAEPVAAIFNAGLVLAATAFIVFEAVDDLQRGGSPRADIMLYVALGALLVNGLSAWMIHDAIDVAHALGEHAPDEDGAEGDHGEHDHGHAGHAHAHAGHAHAGHDHGHAGHARAHAGHDHERVRSHAGHSHPHGGHGHALNLRGAWLHLLGDALASLAALIAAVLIRFGFSPKIDPAASFIVAGILAVGALRLLRDAGLILLEAAPAHLSAADVERVILAVEGVAGIHELHVWTLGAGHDAVSAHVLAEVPDAALGSRVERAIRQRFQVEYITVQVEEEGAPCPAVPINQPLGT